MKKVECIVLLFLIVLSGCTYQKEAEPMKQTIHKPVVAGSFYPADAKQLDSMIAKFLNNAEKKKVNGTLKAVIAPHAGYQYSGQVAAYSFKQISKVKKVIVMAPSHQAYFSGAALLNVTHFETPLGLIKVSDVVKDLAEKEPFHFNEEAFAAEHSLEVELPFLQKVLGDFELIPIIIGEANPKDIANVLINYIDDDTLIVASSDLSHYHPYDEAVKLDTKCTSDIVKINYTAVAKDELCGVMPVLTLMAIAEKKGWKVELLKYANSGDITGDKSGVVGYSAIAFYEPHEKESEKAGELSKEDQKFLLKLARETLESYLKNKKTPKIDESKLSPALKEKKGCFVTLNIDGKLRGCIGTILPEKKLYQCVIENAVNAAVNDPRFSPVVYDELKDIEIEISVLSVPEELAYKDADDLMNKLQPNVDGVILRAGMYGATYLPQVWEMLPDKEEFLSSLCEKADLSGDYWKKKKMNVQTYQAFVFHE